MRDLFGAVLKPAPAIFAHRDADSAFKMKTIQTEKVAEQVRAGYSVGRETTIAQSGTFIASASFW